jgi:hypothetical protein
MLHTLPVVAVESSHSIFWPGGARYSKESLVVASFLVKLRNPLEVGWDTAVDQTGA